MVANKRRYVSLLILMVICDVTWGAPQSPPSDQEYLAKDSSSASPEDFNLNSTNGSTEDPLGYNIVSSQVLVIRRPNRPKRYDDAPLIFPGSESEASASAASSASVVGPEGEAEIGERFGFIGDVFGEIGKGVQGFIGTVTGKNKGQHGGGEGQHGGHGDMSGYGGGHQGGHQGGWPPQQSESHAESESQSQSAGFNLGPLSLGVSSSSSKSSAHSHGAGSYAGASSSAGGSAQAGGPRGQHGVSSQSDASSSAEAGAKPLPIDVRSDDGIIFYPEV